MSQSIPKTKIYLYTILGFLLNFPIALYVLRKVFIKDFGRVNSLAIHITEKCNLNCIYCNQHNFKGRDMNFQKFCMLVDDAKANGISEVTLSGGEPFVHPDIFRMLDYCQIKGLKPLIYTNGTQISKARVARLRTAKGLCLIFKFDSPFSYAKHVSSDIYKKVSNAIMLCTTNGIRTLARINITNKNMNYLQHIFKDAFKLGAEPVIERHMPLKQDVQNKKLELNTKEWQNALKEYYECCAKHIGINTKTFQSYKNNQAKLMGYKCFGFNSTIVIHANGDAFPCGLAPNELSVGNINKQPLSAILKEYYKQRGIWRKIPAGCKKCSQAEICRGGCKAYTYLKLKRFDKKDPLCNGSLFGTQ